MRDYNTSGVVKLRLHAGKTGLLTVPAQFMKQLTAGCFFRPEWTEDGILYRYMGATPPGVAETPEWTRNGRAA